MKLHLHSTLAKLIVNKKLKEIGYSENLNIEIINSKNKSLKDKYVKFLFEKLHRKEGLLERDCDKLVRNDRVIWASCMVECGDADAMVTGNTRRYSSSLKKVIKVVDARPGEIMFGLNMIVNKGKTVFIADTTVHEYPTSKQMAEIAISASRVVRLFGFDPKVAFLSHSTFGQPITRIEQTNAKLNDVFERQERCEILENELQSSD